MIALRRSYGGSPWYARILLGAFVAGMFPGLLLAEDRHVVARDGRKVRVSKSNSEFAITFRDFGKIQATARNLATAGHGVVEDVAGATDSPIKLARVAETTAARRSLLRRNKGIAEVHTVYRYEDSDTPLLSTGTIVVKLPRDLTAEQRERLWADYSVTVVEPVAGLRDVYCIKPLRTSRDEVLRAEKLAEDSRTLWAQPNFRIPPRPRQVSAADEFFNMQWHLHNTGQLGGASDADIDAPEAWLLGEGQDVLIGMFDDSCDVDHEDLRSNYIGVGHDPSLQSTDGGFDDPRPKGIGDSHGTAVMGLAVARANGIGVRGVAFLSRFTVSRGLNDLLTTAEQASAYTFARQQEVDVHINSWGLAFGILTPAIIEDAIETAFLEGRDLDGDDGPEPPRGMVVLFASGNGINNFGPGVRVDAGRELATLPTVIGVGATNDQDEVTYYSNFGPEIDVLAPGGGDFAGIATVDNDDAAGYVDDGYNIGGFDSFGFQDIASDGLYTGTFAGTSAACPIAAGVASLILSVNTLLTATDVRLILEHTTDRINPEDADYNPITHRSVRYGYGRINAAAATQAAQDAIANGGRTWPERPADVRFLGTELRWLQNGDHLEFMEFEEDDEGSQFTPLRTIDEFLVIESDVPFDFDLETFPVDGACYDPEQLGCTNATISPLPAGASILATGCGLSCGVGATGVCEAGAEQCVDFIQPSSKKYYAIFGRSSVGRYSFGVLIDSEGTLVDPGQLPPGASGSTGGGGGVIEEEVGPKVVIDPKPLWGTSPLLVRFKGNATSKLPIDETRTVWNFGDDSPTVNDRTPEHTYVAPAGETKVYTARLTMYDTAGNLDTAQADIHVEGPEVDDMPGPLDESDVRIVIVEPGGATDVNSGVSPFEVELHIEVGSLVGDLQSVVWDLGDGTRETGTLVFHTYENETASELRLIITATVTTRTSGSTILQTTTSQRVTILPGTSIEVPDEPSLPGVGADGPGGEATPCGAIGLLPLFMSLAGTMWLRKRQG